MQQVLYRIPTNDAKLLVQLTVHWHSSQEYLQIQEKDTGDSLEVLAEGPLMLKLVWYFLTEVRKQDNGWGREWVPQARVCHLYLYDCCRYMTNIRGQGFGMEGSLFS